MSVTILKGTNIILYRTNQTNQTTVLKKTSNLFWMSFFFFEVTSSTSSSPIKFTPEFK